MRTFLPSLDEQVASTDKLLARDWRGTLFQGEDQVFDLNTPLSCAGTRRSSPDTLTADGGTDQAQHDTHSASRRFGNQDKSCGGIGHGMDYSMEEKGDAYVLTVAWRFWGGILAVGTVSELVKLFLAADILLK